MVWPRQRVRELNRPDDAIAAYNKALALKPNLAEAHAGYGTVLAKLDRYDEALTAYNRAFALKPGLEFVEGERLHCKMRLCDWSNFGAESTHLISSIRTGMRPRRLEPSLYCRLPKTSFDAGSFLARINIPLPTPRCRSIIGITTIKSVLRISQLIFAIIPCLKRL